MEKLPHSVLHHFYFLLITKWKWNTANMFMGNFIFISDSLFFFFYFWTCYSPIIVVSSMYVLVIYSVSGYYEWQYLFYLGYLFGVGCSSFFQLFFDISIGRVQPSCFIVLLLSFNGNFNWRP